MPFDLVLSEHNDLVFAGNRDLAGASGIDLVEQRIRLRLKLRRGTWLYDEERTLGSQLYRLSGMSPTDVHAAVDAFVREALRPMEDEITITEVTHTHDGTVPEEALVNREVELVVRYLLNNESEFGTEGVTADREITFTLQLGGGGI